MFDRIQRSWDLTRECYALIAADRSLLLFPLMSVGAMILILASFALPMLPLLGYFRGEHSLGGAPALSYVALFLFYWVQYSIVIFFNTALVEVAMRRFDGKDATISDGLRRAWSLVPTILAYAAIAAFVGTLLRAIAERVGFIGRIVVGLLGFAWTVATALVVPVLVAENVGPVEAVQRSTALIKKTWGEDLIGNAGIGIVFGLIVFGTLVVGFGLAAAAFSTGSGPLGAVLAGTTVLALVFIMLTQSTLHGIYAAALYRYASNDPATGPIDKALLQGAFRTKA